MAAPPPQYLPPPPQPIYAPPPTPPKSRTAVYVVVAVLIVVGVVGIAAIAYNVGSSSPPTNNPGGGGGGSTTPAHEVVTPHSQTVDQTSSQPFGPGLTGIGVFSFTVPIGATAAWVNGSFSVTQCTSIGDYCLANALIMTPTAYQNWASGGTVSTVWCYTAGTSSCQAEQTEAIATGNISSYSGSTLDLVLESGATTLSQEYACDVTLAWNTAAWIPASS